MLDDNGIGYPTIYFMNVTVLLIASMPVVYLGKRRNECRNFNGRPLEKNTLGRLKRDGTSPVTLRS